MRLLSIDPGTVTCGICIMDIDIPSFKVVNINTTTLYINNELDLETRLVTLYNYIRNLVIEIQPEQFAHEAGFINRFRPQAYGPIYAAIFMMRKAYRDVLPFNNMFSYPPKSVKAVMSTGTAGKDDMLLAVTKNKELKRFITGYETEHEIDAIAIGYTHLLNIRNNFELLFF